MQSTTRTCHHTTASVLLCTQSVELHGFSDASEAVYAAVMYVRATYQHHPPTCRIVKTKFSPVKSLSMPRLELCRASLLSKVLTTIRQALSFPIERAWSDSSIVIAWLDGSPKRYQTYVSNRIASITNLIRGSMCLPRKTRQTVPQEASPRLNLETTACGRMAHLG